MWKCEYLDVAGSPSQEEGWFEDEADTQLTEWGTKRTSVLDDAIGLLVQTIPEACPVFGYSSGRGQVSFACWTPFQLGLLLLATQGTLIPQHFSEIRNTSHFVLLYWLHSLTLRTVSIWVANVDWMSFMCIISFNPYNNLCSLLSLLELMKKQAQRG